MDIDISLIFGDAARWIMPVLALLVAAFCVPSLLKGNKKIGVTGYLVNEANGDRLPLSGVRRAEQGLRYRAGLQHRLALSCGAFKA